MQFDFKEAHARPPHHRIRIKKQLRAGSPKMGLFLNAHSPTVAEQLAHSGYDWLLVDLSTDPWATKNFPPC